VTLAGVQPDSITRAPDGTAAIATAQFTVQNLRRGHYALAIDLAVHDRVRTAFTELVSCL
jgi:hypothetical protein